MQILILLGCQGQGALDTNDKKLQVVSFGHWQLTCTVGESLDSTTVCIVHMKKTNYY